uniref:DDE_Tnp_1_7 domain-containing protein n=1 Tax=Caenorhabditis tropicalis TaxID=1561998 RepID=A0A1I7TL54_9PELO
MNSSNFIHVFGKSVVVGLAKSFGLNLPTEYSTWTLNEEEKRWHDRISLMIRCAESGEMVMRDRYELDRHDSEYDDGDLEWDYEEEATSTLRRTETVHFRKRKFCSLHLFRAGIFIVSKMLRLILL